MQRSKIKGLAWWESKYPYFCRLFAKEEIDPVRAEVLIRAALVAVDHALELNTPWGQLNKLASQLTHRGLEHFRGAICFCPGYHSNSDTDRERDREDHAFGLFRGLAVHLLRMHRPWYREPRWHVHHWRLKIKPLFKLKRWLFTRCEGCGKRFGWRQYPVAAGWNAMGGPRWFRNEPGLFHSDCFPRSRPTTEANGANH